MEEGVTHRICIPLGIRKRHFDQMTTRVTAQDSGDAEIDIANNVPRQNHKVPRVKVSVIHAVRESVAKKVVNEPACKQVGDEVRTALAAPGMFVPKILRDGHPIQKLCRKNASCCVTPQNCRYFFKWILFSMTPKLVHVMGFFSVIKLILGPGNEFFRGLDNPIQHLEPQYLDRTHDKVQCGDVGSKMREDRWPSDFYGQLERPKISYMDLSNRAGRDGPRVKGIKNVSRSSIQVFLERLFYMLVIKRGYIIEETEQAPAILQREQVGLDSQHLAKFDKRSADLFKSAPQALRTRQGLY